jgi:hypothetical protein
VIERADEDAGGHHRRLKARALLIRPVHDLDGGEGLVSRRDEGAERFEGRQHAERAVELASGGLGVEVAAHGDRRHVRALSRAVRKHRAHAVHRDGAAQGFRALLEPVAHLTVELAQREPADAAVRGGANRRRLHELAPEPGAVDLQVGSAGHDASQFVETGQTLARGGLITSSSAWTGSSGARSPAPCRSRWLRAARPEAPTSSPGSSGRAAQSI